MYKINTGKWLKFCTKQDEEDGYKIAFTSNMKLYIFLSTGNRLILKGVMG